MEETAAVGAVLPWGLQTERRLIPSYPHFSFCAHGGFKIWQGKLGKAAYGESPAHRAHQVLIKMQIMERVQTRGEDLSCNRQMAQIRTRKMLTRITRTLLVDGARVRRILRPANVQFAKAGKQG